MTNSIVEIDDGEYYDKISEKFVKVRQTGTCKPTGIELEDNFILAETSDKQYILDVPSLRYRKVN